MIKIKLDNRTIYAEHLSCSASWCLWCSAHSGWIKVQEKFILYNNKSLKCSPNIINHWRIEYIENVSKEEVLALEVLCE